MNETQQIASLKAKISELESDLENKKEYIGELLQKIISNNNCVPITFFGPEKSDPVDTKPEQTEEPEINCYEIWRPNIPANGCKTQCKECAAEEKLKVGEVEHTKPEVFTYLPPDSSEPTESQKKIWLETGPTKILNAETGKFEDHKPLKFDPKSEQPEESQEEPIFDFICKDPDCPHCRAERDLM